jgi:hypothetical protein
MNYFRNWHLNWDLSYYEKTWKGLFKWGAFVCGCYLFYKLNSRNFWHLFRTSELQSLPTPERDVFILRSLIYELVGIGMGLRVFYLITTPA